MLGGCFKAMLSNIYAPLRLAIGLLLLLSLPQSLWAANTIDVSPAKNNLILTPIHGGNGSAWGRDRCNSCHIINTIHKDAPLIRDIVKDKGYPTCAGCHGNNGVDTTVRYCVICHNSHDLPQSPVLNEPKNHNFDTNNDASLKDKDCLVCHATSDMDGQFELNTDLTHFPNKAGRIVDYNNSSEFCTGCHNLDHQQPEAPITGTSIQGFSARHPLVAMETNWNFLDVHGKRKGSGERTYAGLRENVYKYGSVVECVDCHVMHGTHNDKLIIDSTAKGVFKFPDFVRKTPYLIDTPNGDFSQMCVICHAMETLVEQGAQNTGNGFSGVHQVGTDCRECHTHGMAAQTGL